MLKIMEMENYLISSENSKIFLSLSNGQYNVIKHYVKNNDIV
jgi:hypothetical protein